jgi:hypothetical protein
MTKSKPMLFGKPMRRAGEGFVARFADNWCRVERPSAGMSDWWTFSFCARSGIGGFLLSNQRFSDPVQAAAALETWLGQLGTAVRAQRPAKRRARR